MNAKEKSFAIINGPSKDLLFDACKYAYSKNLVSIEIKLSVAAGYTTPPSNPGCACITMPLTGITICSIEHEDNSGDSFNIRGYCAADPECLTGISINLKKYYFKAYYCAKNRKGTISFTKQP